MTQQTLNDHILTLQCKHSTWTTDFEKALSLGQCSQKFIDTNIEIIGLLGPMYRYKTFTEEVTNAASITILRLENNTDVTVTIIINAVQIATYTGKGSSEDIILALYKDAKDTFITHNYLVEIKDNTLYLYTYDITQLFTYLPVITVIENDVVMKPSLSTTSISIEDNLDLILDLWNCLTFCMLCDLKKKIESLLGNCNC